MRSRWIRRLSSAAIVLSLTLPAAAVSATQANEPTTSSPRPASTSATATASVYVYWSYWTQPSAGTWALSAAGAGTQTPVDGSVIGWRYGVGSIDGINQPPRSGDTFDRLCASTPAATGKKRVGVVVDSGIPAVAASGQQPPPITTACASVPSASNALQVTGAITAERTTPEGMVCGLGGYPASGCGSQVSATVATTDPGGATTSGETSTAGASSANAWPTLLGVAVIIVLGAGGILIARKRRG